MGQTLYLECTGGISGDMTVAALLDLGADEKGLVKGLESIEADGFKIVISRVKKSGLDCNDFDVILDDVHENHDHDMEYLYGHEHDENTHSHEHHHDDISKHNHHHHNEHSHEHNHMHRGMPEITAIINSSSFNQNTKDIALKIFDVIAHAEAKAHGVELSQVHFHEVGAIDSIVDILSVAYCIDNLNITEVIVPYLTEGQGTVRCQHGILPIPVPAVTNIIAEHGIKLKLTDIYGELVTPTGAAIVAALKTSDSLPEIFSIKKIGLGAGKRDYETAGILRAMIIE